MKRSVRLTGLAAFSLAAVVVVTACGSSAPPPMLTKAEHLYDGASPATCGANGKLNNPKVRTVAGSRLSIVLPDHTRIGRLVLRQSRVCPVVWGEIFFNSIKVPSGTFSVHLIVFRPRGADPRAIAYVSHNRVSPVFSSILADDQDSGCVQATGWVVFNGRPGPVQTTRCKMTRGP